MKITIKGFISSKEAELFYDCADRYAINQDHNKFAISDGVSKSFFPKVWAEVLVNNWVKQEWTAHKQYIEYCQREWLQKITEIVNKPETKWFTKNAFNRKDPALATFVGLQFEKVLNTKTYNWKVYALGDSFLFFVPKDVKNFDKDVIKCSSIDAKDGTIEFDNYPDYLTSIGVKHKGTDKKQKKDTYELQPGTFYLMTDALAEWFLNQKHHAIDRIDLWEKQEDFVRFIGEERLSYKLGNDDSAILIIRVEEDNKEELDYVFGNYSKINDLIDKEKEEIEEAANQKKLEESKKVISSEETNENELSENEYLTDRSIDIETPKKGFLEKGKQFLFGKKEKTELIIETNILNEETKKQNPLEINKVTKSSEESVKGENQEVSVTQSEPNENNKTSQNDESEITTENSTIVNPIKESEKNEINNKSTDSKKQTQKKDSKYITDKF